VARGGDEVDAEATNVVHRVQEGGELPVAGVAGARIEVAEMQRPAEHPADLGGGAGGFGVPVGCWSHWWHARVIGHDLDPQVVAAARREFEVPSDGNCPAPWILGTAAAKNAPREVKGDVTASCVETLRERTRRAD
jgi:hypothetical protein